MLFFTRLVLINACIRSGIGATHTGTDMTSCVPVQHEYQGSCYGVISAPCVKKWEKEAAMNIVSVDMSETKGGKCLIFMLYDKSGKCDSVVTHELSAEECTPSAIWPVVRDVMYAAGSRSATNDLELRSLCNNKKTTIRLPVSSTGYMMHITMVPKLCSIGKFNQMVVWAFAGQSCTKPKLFLVPVQVQYTRALSAVLGKLVKSDLKTQIEYSIILDAPPLILGTVTCVGAEKYTFSRVVDISVVSMLA